MAQADTAGGCGCAGVSGVGSGGGNCAAVTRDRLCALTPTQPLRALGGSTAGRTPPQVTQRSPKQLRSTGAADLFSGASGTVLAKRDAAKAAGGSAALAARGISGDSGIVPVNTDWDCSSPAIGQRPARLRSASPPSLADEANLARCLRERDDEIIRLREQVRRGVAWGPKWSPTSEVDPSKRHLYEENAKLKQSISQLQDRLKMQSEGCNSGPSKSAESTARPQVVASSGLSPEEWSTLPTPTSLVMPVERDKASTCKAAWSPPSSATGTGGTPDDLCALREELGRCVPQFRENFMNVSHRSPRSSLTLRMFEIQRQLQERMDEVQEAQSVAAEAQCAAREAQAKEETLREQVARLEARCAVLEERSEHSCEQHMRRPAREEPRQFSEPSVVACRDALAAQDHLRSQRSHREPLTGESRSRVQADEAVQRHRSSPQHRDREAVQRYRSSPQHRDREAEQQRRIDQLEAQVSAQNAEMAKWSQVFLQFEEGLASGKSSIVLGGESKVALGSKNMERCQSLESIPSRTSLGSTDVVLPVAVRCSGATSSASTHATSSNGGIPQVGAIVLPIRETPATLQGGSAGGPGTTSNSAVSHSSCSSSYATSSDESSTGSSSAAAGTNRPCWSGRSSSPAMRPIGESPLPKIHGVGWYFRVRVDSAAGWAGGLSFGIGVSLASCKAQQRPHNCRKGGHRSWAAGYWGSMAAGRRARTIAEGLERLCEWKPQEDLQQGDEVAFLVTLEGECALFVNDEECCRFADPLVPVATVPEVHLTALIDFSSTAASATFLKDAPLPPSVLPARPLQSPPAERTLQHMSLSWAGSPWVQGKVLRPATSA